MIINKKNLTNLQTIKIDKILMNYLKKKIEMKLTQMVWSSQEQT